MTEKRLAILMVFILMLAPLVYMFRTGLPTNADEWLFFAINLLIFWGTSLFACILYIGVRFAALAGAAFGTTLLFSTFAYMISQSGDPKSGALWYLYFGFCAVIFLLSVYPAWKKPKFLIQSARNAFIFAALPSLLGIIASVI